MSKVFGYSYLSLQRFFIIIGIVMSGMKHNELESERHNKNGPHEREA